MPTYTNNTDSPISLKNSQGLFQTVDPGETISTTWFYDHSSLGLTEDSPTPYYDDVVQEDQLTSLSSTAQTVTIAEDARKVLVHMITDNVTVRRNVDSATPIFRGQTSDDPIFFIDVDGIPGRTKQLKITGAGDCRVVQFALD